MLALYLALSVVLIVVLTARLSLHPFIALLLASLFYGLVAGMPMTEVVASINQGFGATLGGIGLIIIFGVIIGTFLENTGGAYVIADRILRLVGRQRVAPAMGIMGWVVSIPVFADSGFMLLSALNRSLSRKAGVSLAGTAIALSLGLTCSHTMVPPTPGPIAAAGILGADLGYVLALGIPVSLVALAAALLFATKYVARTWIEPAPELTDAQLENLTRDAPSAARALLPILVPILLILAASLVKALGLEASSLTRTVEFLGTPFVALFIGAGLAFTLPREVDRRLFSVSGWVGKALASVASILLITGAGGAFGKTLQNSGIADVLAGVLQDASLGIWLPFVLAAAIKTAQGSSTVALITTASILAPLMQTLGFHSDIERAMAVIAIGAGSAFVSHANDSFFWVVTQMSGMDVRTGYRMHSLGTVVVGFSAAATLFLISTFI
jgi:GntP family gluconate:H+ symporter